MPSPILLYDGVCGLCNRFVQFVLRRDRSAIFRFASLQSKLAAGILARHGADPTSLDTVYVVVNPALDQGGESGEVLLARSDAVVFVLQQLGSVWPAAAFLLRLLPTFLRDAVYNTVARRRYRIFGRSETCVLPNPEERNRFLDW